MDFFEKQVKSILLFKLVFVAILLFLGTYLVQVGELNIGQFVASEIIILLVINSVETLALNIGTGYDLVTSLYKIESVAAVAESPSYLHTSPDEKPANSDYFAPVGRKLFQRVLYVFMIVVGVGMFVPWNQTVRMTGRVSVLDPGHKPQKITSRIPGRVEKWFIKDGDLVQKNDTIAYISEIRNEYSDPELLARTAIQIKAKEDAVKAYESKTDAINHQIEALQKNLLLSTQKLILKVEQGSIDVRTDSIQLVLAEKNMKIAEEQLSRYEELMNKGIVSKTELENRKLKVQEAHGKTAQLRNKLQAARNQYSTSALELNSVQQDYREKLMKAESDKFSALSLLSEAVVAASKLKNEYANYSMRKSFSYILSPQTGHITNIAVAGIGEIVKEGDDLCTVVPSDRQQAVELFVDPVDLPLLEVGQKIQLQFDGWPTFFLSGWPGLSYGTFTAEVVAFDRTISPSGKFRVLAKNTGEEWPRQIHLGGAAKGFALLGKVPLIYELWRQANGFPPEYYKKDA